MVLSFASLRPRFSCPLQGTLFILSLFPPLRPLSPLVPPNHHCHHYDSTSTSTPPNSVVLQSIHKYHHEFITPVAAAARAFSFYQPLLPFLLLLSLLRLGRSRGVHCDPRCDCLLLPDAPRHELDHLLGFRPLPPHPHRWRAHWLHLPQVVNPFFILLRLRISSSCFLSHSFPMKSYLMVFHSFPEVELFFLGEANRWIYRVPSNFLWLDPAYHDYHHEIFNCNYGQVGIWDWCEHFSSLIDHVSPLVKF